MRQIILLVSLLFLGGFGGISQVAMATAAEASWTASGISWAQFVDPAERAFAIQVPRGWKVAGGAYRYGKLDIRAMVDMKSPDGKTDLRFGDSNVPPFATLTSTMRNLGWQEGHPYSPNGVAREVVANYRPGWVFADLYGQGRFAQSCQTLKLKEMHQLPPIHENPQARVTAGEVLYTCETAAGPKVVYVFAETQLTQMGIAGAWLVTWLHSFIAPQDQAPEAMKAILHSLGTFEINDQWQARQIQLNGQAGGDAYNQFKQGMAQEHARFARQSAQFQSQVDGFTRAFRGVDLTRDPVDGTQREVWMGTGGTHWIGPLGDVVTSPTSPDSRYRPLQTVQ